MISSQSKTGIYTTTFHEKKWKVLILMHGEKQALELSVAFDKEQPAKDFMTKNEPFLTFATNKAFMMALQAQQMLNS